MSSYQENQQATFHEIIKQLSQTEQTYASQLDLAEINLYYAQEAWLHAYEYVKQNKSKVQLANSIQTQGTLNNELMAIVETTAALSEQQFATTVKNASTAATDVQTAAIALSKLTGELGGVVNIMVANELESEFNGLGNQANTLIQEVAKKAENASQIAMEATQRASEIIAASVKEEATNVHKEIQKLSEVAGQELKALATVQEKAEQTLKQAILKEKTAEGKLEDAHAEHDAAVAASQAANLNLNFDLTISQTAFSLDQKKDDWKFKISFSNYPALPSLHPSLPDLVASYKLYIVEAANQASFLFSQAEMLGSAQAKSYSISCPESPCSKERPFGTTVDSQGNKLKLGVAYVAFLLVEFDEAAIGLVQDFSNLLSLPSAPFTFTRQLPSIKTFEKLTFQSTGGSGKIPATWENAILKMTVDANSSYLAGNIPNNNDVVEYRCFLLYNPPDGTEMVSTTSQSSIPKICFSQAIAEQVPRMNYQQATSNSNSDSENQIEVKFSWKTKDNFGNPLLKCFPQNYVVAVLAVPKLKDKQSVNASYTNTLSFHALDPGNTRQHLIPPSEGGTGTGDAPNPLVKHEEELAEAAKHAYQQAQKEAGTAKIDYEQALTELKEAKEELKRALNLVHTVDGPNQGSPPPPHQPPLNKTDDNHTYVILPDDNSTPSTQE